MENLADAQEGCSLCNAELVSPVYYQQVASMMQDTTYFTATMRQNSTYFTAIMMQNSTYFIATMMQNSTCFIEKSLEEHL